LKKNEEEEERKKRGQRIEIYQILYEKVLRA
jgi:hypothetical protein